MTQKQWKDLSASQRGGIVFLGAVQLTLLIAALVDIYRRPAEKIRGNKKLWVLVSFVNIVGPLAYFLFGRKR
jgi:hypothetical protein